MVVIFLFFLFFFLSKVMNDVYNSICTRKHWCREGPWKYNKCRTRSRTCIVKSSIPLLGPVYNNLCPVVYIYTCERYGGNLRHLARVLAVRTLPWGVTKPDVPKGVDIAYGEKNCNITATR